MSLLFAFALAPSAFALDGSQVVTGGGSVDFTGASSTNWVVNPETGALDFLIAYSNATETAASFSFNGLTSARILAVGGGGGGGAAYRMGFTGTRGGGGGGGAGGFVETEGLYDKGTFDVTVGEGGKAGAVGMVVTALAGGDGSNTTVTVKGNDTPLITAYGGGGGGGESDGRAGGSGGGGSQANGGAGKQGGQVLELAKAEGQGHNGGAGDAALYGGGGGGAGADGTGTDGTGFAASTAGGGRGGDGRESDITGTPTYYAGGGGGGWSSSSTTVPAGLEDGIPGGKGGGGAGGVARNKGINPVAGLDGFGGGGGGCNGNNSGVTGGARGGCGVVIVRVTGSLNGALDKPKDAQIEWNGAAHNVVTPAPFYTIDGDNSFTDIGVYTVKVTPIEGLVWADSGTREAVTVTLTIYQKDSISGTEYVTGAPVSFYGATATNWVSYTDSSGNARQDLVLTFTNAAAFKLPGASAARILAVGGGGGGGAAYRMGFTGTRGGGGGGGAGGFVETEALYGKGTYAIAVGKGGKAGAMGMVVTALAGGDGGDTAIVTNGVAMIKAYGGGGGGGESTGRNGGSGGGGSQKNGGTVQDGGTNLVAAVGQGHNGGKGDAALYGGGGGGAGADGTGTDGTGFAASTAGGGRGGDGRESDITGTPTFYAGGGGGGWSSSSTTVPAGLENGIPGGKGGGGAGGVARNKGINPVAGLDGFGGGGGGANGNNAGVTGGAKGGCGVVIVRISSAMEGEFKRPETEYAFTYDATEHAPVKPNVFYDVTGDYIGTTAGVYRAHVKLHDGVVWPEGGKEELDVTMTISRLPVEITELSIAGWTFHDETTPDPTVAWTTDPAKSHDLVNLILEYKETDASAATRDASGTVGDWSTEKPEHAGTYWLRARSNDTNNFACAEKTVEFSVDKLTVTFSELNQLGWMSGTPVESTPNPSCTVEPSWVKKIFEYESETEPGTWGPTKPTLPGEHKVRVRCENDTDYAYNNLETTFDIINGLGGIYHDYVEITIGLYMKSPTLTNFPLVVSLSETSPIGFLYERAGSTGEDLTFTDASGDVILPYQLITWDTNGTSQVYVRIPELKRSVQKIRLYWKVRDGINPPSHNPDQVWSDWTLADWNKISKPGTSYASPVCRDGKFIDYWTQEPAMSAYYWDTQDDASKKGTITRAAKLKFNTATWYITNLVTGATWPKPANGFPATLDGGIYRLVYELVDETGAYEPLETHKNFTIKGHTPWDDLKGNAGSVTLAGRVLLANNDNAPGHEVPNQGYWQVREVVTNATTGATLTNDVFWVHGTEEHGVFSSDSKVTRMMPGTTHKLCFADGVDEGGEPIVKTLWRMQDVIIGNTTRNDRRLYSSQCILPYSTTGLGIFSYEDRNVRGDMLEAGNLIFRNTLSAVVYSPCYTNGVGTLYFDAINSSSDVKPEHSCLIVEYATETEDHLPPFDEYAKDASRTDIGGELGKITSEQWQRATMLPYFYDGTAFNESEPTNEVTIACTTGNSTNRFYRLVVPINTRKPVRFRIRRVAFNSIIDEDIGCLILLDNIVCSYPQMGANLVSYGHFDENRTKERTLGRENALVPPFPAVTDTAIYGRGKLDTFVNESTNANPKGFVLSSTMHYRWYYLDQASNDWQTVELEAGNDFVAQTPLVLPRKEDGKIPEGDIEYWFETKIDVPYYEYFDYSGLNVGLKGAGDKPLYTEERTTVTNRLTETENWSVRLRAGRLLHDAECYVLHYKTAEDAKPQAVEMEVAGDGLLRGYVQTLNPLEGAGLYVRFEEHNRQTPGAESFASNVTYYALKDDLGDLSHPTTLVAGGTDVWSRVVCDAKTGYLLFRLAEAKQTLTVVHADRQNFNKWTDANRADRLFVGTATYTNDTGTIAGTSEKTREVTAPLDRWHLSLATGEDDMWSEGFKVTKEQMQTQGGYWEVYQPFSKKTSPNGLQVGPGQWVPAYYNDCGTGMALQMEGCGQGYIQFVKEKELSPRGLESIVLDARIAQPITHGDFAFFSATASDYTNYTFWCRATYDVFKRKAFKGNATLSLVAFYRSGEGFYELRVMQDDAKRSGDDVSGPGDTQRLRLYRWNYDDVSGEVLPTFLGETTLSGSSVLTTDGSSSPVKYGLLFISAQDRNNKTEIVAGLSTDCQTVDYISSPKCQTLSYRDASDDRIANGTYGVLSANCPAEFRYLNYLGKAQSCSVDKDNAVKSAANVTFNPAPSGVERKTCQSDIAKGNWMNTKRRMITTDMGDGTKFGLVAKEVSQTVKVYVGNAGSASFDEPFREYAIADFGSTVPIRIPMYTTTDGNSVRIEAGGEKNQMRTDVVVDNIEFRQWRGESYDDEEGKRYFDNLAYGSPTNFVFTTAWNKLGAVLVDGKEKAVTNCQLCARRARVGEVVSIRSPIFDGGGSEEDGTKRGIGLGRFEFTYTNATTNVVLCLQIATNNVSITGLASLTKEMNSNWTTVTNYDFATLPSSGTLKHYFGLHDVKGVMRIAIHPDVIRDFATTTNELAFGSIEITGVLCSDEPKVDERSWWGWNVRTTDEHERRNLWDATPTGFGEGLGFALNNAIDGSSILEKDKELYKKHLPFLQTPTFGEGINVGEVSFRVRKYAKDDPPAYVTLYGAPSGGVPDADWKKLERWEVTNEVYETKTFKTKSDVSYSAFRFAVSGVAGVETPTMEDGENPRNPERVLLDDVLVYEAIRASVAFRNVSAFRTNLDTLLAIENVTDRAQQPLCREAWGVQAEVYAEQLAGELDLSKAKVRLWWYESEVPWGFERWKNLPGAKSAELPRCIGTDPDVYIFRSSYAGGMGTVLPEQTRAGTVQFMLEVEYENSDGASISHLMRVGGEAAEWTNPPWYAPVDYNATLGEDYLFASAYSIFDTVAPGWAWFNEVNIFGNWDEVDYENTDIPFQFLEIAAPFDADLTGWSVRFLDAQGGSGKIVTNEVAYFGSSGLPGVKRCQEQMDPVSKCVFHVIASPAVVTFDPDKGEIDGRWKITKSNWAVGLNGEASASYPLAMQLVRPSGIIEHEIVLLGTNDWAGSEYDPHRHVDALNANERGGRWFYAGMDYGGQVMGKDGSRSIGVHWGNGGTEKTMAEDASRYWNSTNYMTPGAINGQQVISPDCPRPLGSSAIIISQLTGGHMTQSFGDAERTNGLVSILFRKGDKNGTNITYHVERWYELATLTTNGAPLTVPVPVGHDYVVNVGREISNDVMVVASADVMADLEAKYGIAPDNKYRDALVKWLQDGTLKDGTPFSGPNKDLDKVGLGEYHALDAFHEGGYVAPLTLQSMFWLDMDPTWNDGDLWFCAGTTDMDMSSRAPNVVMKVKMVITNTSDLAEAGLGPGKKYWAPYVLRSSKPDLTSWEFYDQGAGGSWNWGDATFKVTGFMNNGLTKLDQRDNWVPLRWFVFGKYSFDSNFESLIEITDPTSRGSAGAGYGWYQWMQDHPEWSPSFYFRWDIDERLRPVAVELLRPDSRY